MVVNSEVKIGIKSMIEVELGNDVYYIPKNKACEAKTEDTILFYYDRKDLIQVNNVIHADLM